MIVVDVVCCLLLICLFFVVAAVVVAVDVAFTLLVNYKPLFFKAACAPTPPFLAHAVSACIRFCYHSAPTCSIVCLSGNVFVTTTATAATIVTATTATTKTQ